MSFYSDVLSNIICDTVEKEVPRGSGKALQITFRARVDYDKEDGYRWIDLLIYRKTNYTRVCQRERWNVIPLESISYNVVSGEGEIKPGKDYLKGHTDWVLLADHDSCWRYDGVDSFLRTQESRITGLDNVSGNWYKVFEPDFEVPRYSPNP